MFILRIKLIRICVIIFKRLDFLPLSINGEIAKFLENQIKNITEEMIERKYI